MQTTPSHRRRFSALKLRAKSHARIRWLEGTSSRTINQCLGVASMHSDHSRSPRSHQHAAHFARHADEEWGFDLAFLPYARHTFCALDTHHTWESSACKPLLPVPSILRWPTQDHATHPHNHGRDAKATLCRRANRHQHFVREFASSLARHFHRRLLHAARRRSRRWRRRNKVQSQASFPETDGRKGFSRDIPQRSPWQPPANSLLGGNNQAPAKPPTPDLAAPAPAHEPMETAAKKPSKQGKPEQPESAEASPRLPASRMASDFFSTASPGQQS